jgi:hypothetical protein
MVKADYYRRQADLCMRLSLMCDDREIAGSLLNKAIELMGQADEAGPPARPRPPPQPPQQQQQQQQIQPNQEDD